MERSCSQEGVGNSTPDSARRHSRRRAARSRPSPGTPRPAPTAGSPVTCSAQVAALRARAFHLDELVQPQPPRPEEPLGQVLLHQRGHGTRPAASGSPRAAQAATGGTSPGAAPRGSAAGPQPRESREAAARERPGGTSPRPASSLPPSLPPPPAAGRPLGERRCSCLQLGGKLPRAALYK